MLKNTFCHLPGFGTKLESYLWKNGILSWDEIVSGNALPLKKKAHSLKEGIKESFRHLGEQDSAYFARLLPAGADWRIFREFRGECAYLDIETNGIMGDRGYITTIALFDGRSVSYYLKDRNLKDFKNDIKKYKLLVTYNGKSFDLPIIESQFKIKLKQAHIDLRHLLNGLGFSGGLKKCEKTLGIDRQELSGLDGYFAVLLWNDFLRNRNYKAVETLLAYNIQDAVNLEHLMVAAYNLKLRETPFLSTHELALPFPPELPFKADTPTIKRVLSKNYWYSSKLKDYVRT